jgi:acetyltransferase-like isoleucine patch superfamily enzyme
MLSKYIKLYSFSGLTRLIISTVRTRLFFPRAKLIRFPIDIRGKKYLKYGSGFTTGRGCRLESYPVDEKSVTISIGTNVQINDYVHITGIKSIEIGNNVLIASKVYISDSIHGSYSGNESDSNPSSIPKDRKLFFKEVCIKDNVWIGESVSILPGVTIEEGSIIGANSVVTKNIQKNSIAAGNPARIIKQFNPSTKKWERV